MPIDEARLTALVREFLRREVRVADDDVAADTALVSSGLIDSVGLVRLATLLEREFDVAIPDRDITPDHFDSIDRIRAYLSRKATG